MNANQISAAKTSELLAFFNANTTGKQVAKFADRKTAERRVTELVATLAPTNIHTCPSCGATEDQTAAGLEGTAAERRNLCHHCGTEYFPETGKVYKAPASSASRSLAIAKSWMDKAIAEARAERTGVVVKHEGKAYEFGSVRKAFIHFGLPLSKHIKFRMELKAAGKKDFGAYKFSVV